MSISASWNLTGENVVIVASSSLDVLHRSIISGSYNGSCDIKIRLITYCQWERERESWGGGDRNNERVFPYRYMYIHYTLLYNMYSIALEIGC